VEAYPEEEEEEQPLPLVGRGGVDVLIRDENISHKAAALGVSEAVSHLYRTAVLTPNAAASIILAVFVQLALSVKGFKARGLSSEESLGTALGLFAAALSNISSGVRGEEMKLLSTIISVRRMEQGGAEEKKGILSRIFG